VGDHAWAARQWIDESVVVSDEVIVDAQRLIWSELRLAVEPAAAATVAALTTGAYTPPRGSRVVAVLSGGNVDPASVG
jgi:threonine dehydratase